MSVHRELWARGTCPLRQVALQLAVALQQAPRGLRLHICALDTIPASGQGQ